MQGGRPPGVTVVKTQQIDHSAHKPVYKQIPRGYLVNMDQLIWIPTCIDNLSFLSVNWGSTVTDEAK